jgi:hypothetical protein
MQNITRLVRNAALFGAGAAMAVSSGVLVASPLIAMAGAGPTTTLSSSSPTQPTHTGDNPLPVTLTFSSAVTGVTPSMVNVANGTVSNFNAVSSTVYTFNVTPSASGSVSVDFNGNQVQDASSTGNIAAPQLQFIYDPSLPNTTTPAPSISITSGPANGSVVATSSVTFLFTTSNASSVNCSFGSNPATYSCGSPQTFNSLVNGNYPFSITAKNSLNVSTTTTRTFTVTLGSTSTTTATSTPTASTTPSTASSTPTTSQGGGSGGGSGGGGPLLLPSPGGGPVTYYTPGSGSQTTSNSNTTTTTFVTPPPSFSTTGFTTTTSSFADHPGLVSGAGGRLEAAALASNFAATGQANAVVTPALTPSTITPTTSPASTNSSTTAGGLTGNNGTPPANANDNTQGAGLGFLAPSNTALWFTLGLLALLLVGGAALANRERQTMA